MKYLYKHNFKYETKPIKWMCRSEQKQQSKKSMQFILERESEMGRKAEVPIFFRIVIRHLQKMLFDLHSEKKNIWGWNMRNFPPIPSTLSPHSPQRSLNKQLGKRKKQQTRIY